MTAPAQDSLVKRAAACGQLDLSYTTLRRLIKAGKLAEVWVTDTSPRIRQSSIDAYIADRTGQRAASPGAA